MRGDRALPTTCRSGPPVDGPKDPWPRVLSLPEQFVGDPASLSRDSIYDIRTSYTLIGNVLIFKYLQLLISD